MHARFPTKMISVCHPGHVFLKRNFYCVCAIPSRACEGPWDQWPPRMWTLSEVHYSWWRHQMATFSPLLAICAGNSPVTGEFPTQRPVTRSFDVFFDLRPNKRLSKHWWGWWFETPSCPLWRHLMCDLRCHVAIRRCAISEHNYKNCIEPQW